MEEEQEEEGGAGWLVSFADLMTLLFAAFVVLYGITPRGKTDEVVGIATSIREAFIEIPDEVPESLRTGEMFKGKINFEEVKRDSTYNPAIKKFNRLESPLRDHNKDLRRIEIFLDKTSKGSGVQFSLRQAIEVSEYEFGFSLKLLGKSFFIPGSHDLTARGRTELEKILPEIKKIGKRISVEGHTDKTTPKGNYSHIELSALRASKIRNILIGQGKIDHKLVVTSSYGSSRPVASNRSIKGRSKNSRVEIKLIYQDEGRN